MKTKKYNCPKCNKPIKTNIPTKDLVSEKGYWDSVVQCPHCEAQHFKKVWPDGKLEIFALKEGIEYKNREIAVAAENKKKSMSKKIKKVICEYAKICPRPQCYHRQAHKEDDSCDGPCNCFFNCVCKSREQNDTKKRIEAINSGRRVFRVRNKITSAWWEKIASDPESALIKAGHDMCEATKNLEIREYTLNGGWKKCKK